ncbi:MAG: transposase [Acidobacteriia bacterium]|nr:transposase [Terriglobia bacterium]MYC65536.1 transposase [Terriglobia bacterium]
MGRRTSTIDATYHARSPRYSGHYLAEFGYRFNRR